MPLAVADPLIQDNAKKRMLPLTELASKMLYLQGAPLGFEGRPYLKDVWDNCVHDHVVMAGRQVEKSTFLAALALVFMMMRERFCVLYGCPDDNSRMTFSEERLRAFIEESPILKQYFMDGDAVVPNRNFVKLRNLSRIFIRNAARDGANFRGPSPDMLLLDEYEMIDDVCLAVAKESMSHSKYKIIKRTGTPLSLDNPIETAWRKTTMNEWIVPCEHCSGGERKYYINPGLRHVTPFGLICDRCGRRIIPANGRWVSHRPKADSLGHRIPQVVVPWADFHDIYYNKLLEYPIEQFMNEVMGQSHDSAGKVFTEAELRATCTNAVQIVEHPTAKMKNQIMVGGIDWGDNQPKSKDTVLKIYAVNGEHLDLAFARIYPKTMGLNNKTRDIIAKLFEFNVAVTVADYGMGQGRNEAIAEALKWPGRFFVCMFSPSVDQVEMIKGELSLLKLSKVAAINTFVGDVLRRGIFRHPVYDPTWAPFAQHFLNERKEMNHSTGNVHYFVPEGLHDDAMMAALYAGIAKRLRSGKPVIDAIPTIGASSRTYGAR